MTPMLFTLLIADIPENLKMTGRGLKIQEVKLSSMMYADGIVLLTENELDMAILLSKLIHEVDESKLQINFFKSMMICINQRVGVAEQQ